MEFLRLSFVFNSFSIFSIPCITVVWSRSPRFLPDMSLSEVYKQVSENIAEIGPIKGLNNHEGSLITCDVMKIGAVLDAVLDNGIFFVDSRTSAQTKAPQAALERDMKILERDVFIDDIISKEEL